MTTILSSAGTYFDFTNPEAFDYDISIIAAGLSKLCRFTGQTREFYSVAQHCVLGSEQVPHQYRMEMLMHDASEALLGDVASPLKALLPGYKDIERRAEHAIAKQHALLHPMPPEIKVADLRMLATEKRDLLPPTQRPWQIGHPPYAFRIDPWTPEEAEHEFLQAYELYLYQRMSEHATR